MNLRDIQRETADQVQIIFGQELALDKRIRQFRFLEEAIELLQAAGMERDEMIKVMDYVLNRPVGDMGQEVGGTFITLLALCHAYGFDAEAQTSEELERCGQPSVIDRIRMKQMQKPNPYNRTPLAEEKMMRQEERQIRRMLCMAYAGPLAYMDDGEAQDTQREPGIDFLRMSPEVIQSRMQERARNCPNTQAEIEEWHRRNSVDGGNI